ncbi:P1 family peptidase [Streptomyces sp. MST-110588]|uniref:P1 family peptidase n=1 Tax=Streptomyces sp. MST-110588 TaxID=2833628 RepID=UPI001F5C4E69|nr:P1 family peptidase [Streptomyces sp. MST-110588]UNO41507.1 P1 family peptidase [Streptomyces sp. MST-110588]
MADAPSSPDRPLPSGPLDALTDVAGLRVGHAQRVGDGHLTGTTVVLAPEGGALAAVDVRGGGPGTRETDALDPRNLVQRVEAVVLTGGSAFGLDAASGVVAWLEEQGRGFRVGPDPAQVVPVVPAAALFDLGRGGAWRARPDAALGRAAVEAAARTAVGSPVPQGNVGAGTGAVAGGLKGGIGTASLLLPSGITVAALAAVNAAGSVVDPRTGLLYGEYGDGAYADQTDGDGRPDRDRGPVDAAVLDRARQRLAQARAESEQRSAASVRTPLNTTLAVVATDATLSRAQAQKLAGTAHDGLARAVRPVHLLTDGDTVFTLATGTRPLASQEAVSDPAFGAHAEAGALNDVLAAGADALTRAVVRAVRAAETVRTPGGVFPSYRELYGR